jgi:hypothetical protein
MWSGKSIGAPPSVAACGGEIAFGLAAIEGHQQARVAEGDLVAGAQLLRADYPGLVDKCTIPAAQVANPEAPSPNWICAWRRESCSSGIDTAFSLARPRIPPAWRTSKP